MVGARIRLGMNATGLSPLVRYRISLGFFIVGLVLSGITAFPLLKELELLASIFGVTDAADYQSLPAVQGWIAYVYHGLRETYAAYPFVAYGTDWLAFGHLIIALFFVGPFVAPVRNEWVLYCGMAACFFVFPLAFICGPIRGIPVYWRLIDCSFGLFGLVPLLYCKYLTRQLRREGCA